MKNEKQTILVVDDAVENLNVAANLLQNDYSIQVATSGELALSILKNSPLPDLILLDIVMPGIDGYEVINRIKSNPATKDIPVIFLTVKDEIKYIIKGFQCGAVDYIFKPFNILELESRVKTHITIKRQQDQITKKNIENREFLHILCHDLNNSFGVLKMAVDIANSDSVSGNLDKYKDHITLAVNNGVDIISLVLEMCRVEESKFEVSSVNLSDILKDAKALLINKLENKELKLLIDIDKNIFIDVEKRSFLNSVILNLLSNAIKFSYRGSSIIVKAKKDENSFVEISVKDSGIGIPEKLIDGVFDVSLTKSLRGTEGELGTGFGLPLVKKFIELYDGEINIYSKTEEQSPADHGTDVKIYLKVHV